MFSFLVAKQYNSFLLKPPRSYAGKTTTPKAQIEYSLLTLHILFFNGHLEGKNPQLIHSQEFLESPRKYMSFNLSSDQKKSGQTKDLRNFYIVGENTEN